MCRTSNNARVSSNGNSHTSNGPTTGTTGTKPTAPAASVATPTTTSHDLGGTRDDATPAEGLLNFL